jgi:hypothetical protein
LCVHVCACMYVCMHVCVGVCEGNYQGKSTLCVDIDSVMCSCWLQRPYHLKKCVHLRFEDFGYVYTITGGTLTGPLFINFPFSWNPPYPQTQPPTPLLKLIPIHPSRHSLAPPPPRSFSKPPPASLGRGPPLLHHEPHIPGQSMWFTPSQSSLFIFPLWRWPADSAD